MQKFGAITTPVSFRAGVILKSEERAYFELESGVLHPLRLNRVYRMPAHLGHTVPMAQCTCGIKSTINSDWLLDRIFFPKHTDDVLKVVIIGQVLGRYHIDEDMNIRSEMFFPVMFAVYYNLRNEVASFWYKRGVIDANDKPNPLLRQFFVDSNGSNLEDFVNYRWSLEKVRIKYDWHNWTKDL